MRWTVRRVRLHFDRVFGGDTRITIKALIIFIKLDGKVPVGKAIPFGLQHILAMFVANIAPILIVAGACGLSAAQTTILSNVR